MFDMMMVLAGVNPGLIGPERVRVCCCLPVGAGGVRGIRVCVIDARTGASGA